jgi:2-polyprenyl-3-methyl-5-hydroxy-6-metoxy-1,4-benzoquinol methylase
VEKTGDFHTSKQWWDIYTITVRNSKHPKYGERVTYGRAYAQMVKNPQDMEITYFHDEVKQLERHFRIGRSQRILVVGCGFGYLVEAMMDLNYHNVFGMDNSAWIVENRHTESRPDVPILEIGILDEGLIPHLANRTGPGKFDWVIDEHLLEGYLDEQHPPLIEAMSELVARPQAVIHMIQPLSEGKTGSPTMNWKTLDEWAAIAPMDRWIAPDRNEVR